MSFKIKDGLKISTVDVFAANGALLVNAPTATKLETARTISLTGDATGSASFDGSADVSIDVTISGFDGSGGTPTFTGNITGDLIGDVYASNGTSKILENGTDGTNATFTGSVTGNASTASAWENARTITLGGDLSGSVSIDGSQNVTLTATIEPNSVALGTDTTGDYVESISATGGTGISVTGTGESATVTIAGIDANNTTKGVASFSPDNFTVSSGAVSIKDGGISNAELVNDSVTIGSTEVTLGTTQTAIAGLTQLDVDNIRIDGNSISATNGSGNIVLVPEGSGVVDVSTSRITNVVTPTSSTDAANKQYVDDVAQGLRTLPSAEAYSAANLSATYNNGTNGVGATLTSTSNGAFPQTDGVTLSQGDNIIVNGQTNKAHNGSYVLTTVGDAGTPWVLTRCGFCDEASEQAGSFEFVTGGTTYSDTGWVLTVASEPVVMGTTELEWVQFSGAGTYTAGDGLDLTGTVFSVNVDDSSIEISSDALRVKASGITNAMLANPSFTIAADTGTADAVALGETLTFVGGTGIATIVADNQITIDGEDATTTTKGIASFNSSFFTVSSGAVSIAENAIALGTNTTGNYVDNVIGGTGIAVTGSAGEGWEPTISLSFLGLENLTDPNADRIAFWDDSAGAFAWLTVGTGLEISGTNLNNTQQAFKTISVSGQDSVVADQVNDTLTLVGETNITVETDAATNTIKISSAAAGDSAYETITETVATTAKTTIDSFPATNRSAKYYIQITQGTNYQISELLVIHNGTTTYDTEFAVIETNGELGTITTEISGTDVLLSVEMATATSATFNIKRLLFT